MKVLLLAPQPFYQERGTPIAVRLAAEALADKYNAPEDRIDLLVYHEGEKIGIPGVTIHRVTGCDFIKNISPGISLKKLVCDIFFFFAALRLVWAFRRDQYHLVHAVEESVFIAVVLKFIFRIPYIYDMDSSIALQATEKWIILKPLYPILSAFEKLGIKLSQAVVPVCDTLAVLADRHGSKHTHILRDVSLKAELPNARIDLRQELGIDSKEEIILYVGNLESYQGVDLLVDGFLSVEHEIPSARLVIIGGSESHRNVLKERTKDHSAAERIHIAGPRPVTALGEYLSQADILASPRSKGNNTPMKIYSYLHSGRAILATDLPTHTQVLNTDVSLLVAANSTAIGTGLKALVVDHELRKQLGKRAFDYAEQNFTLKVFRQRLWELYTKLERALGIENKASEISRTA